MLDLLIIGAGLSGLSAALEAAKAGKAVRVIAKGMGATHWHTGAIDWLGYLPESGAAVDNPLHATSSLHHRHPYARIGADAVAASLSSFRKSLAAAGLNYGSADTDYANLWLPSPVGAARPTFMAPTAQMAGDLSREDPILVVGFHGMRDFYPQLIAENLNRQGYASRAEFLPLSTITHRLDSSTVQLAHSLEDKTRQHALATALQKVTREGERIGLPAILGVESHTGILDSMQRAMGAPIFEIPTLPPSVPGIRLHDAIVRYLRTMDVRVEIGMAVTTFSAENRQIQWVATETGARPLKHRAASYLLATGGVLGGGFDSDPTGRFWEVIFQLPVTVPQDRTKWFRPEFLDPRGQPVFLGGVSVNDSYQPIGADGAVLYANLWSSGGLLTRADPIQERSLEGIAIVTGIAATQAILKPSS